MRQSSLLTISEAAKCLNVSYNTIRNAIKSRRLHAFRFGERGGTYRIDPVALESYKAECATWAELERPQLATISGTKAKGKKFECLDGDRLAAAWRKQGICLSEDGEQPETTAEHVA